MSRQKESMDSLEAQKKAYLESELGELRYKIKEQKAYGYDQIEMQASFATPFKIYVAIILILFVFLGAGEELTSKNTWLNKWVKAKLGHKDFH